MTAPLVAFWLFAVLTAGFAVALLIRIVPRPQPKSELTEHAAAAKGLAMGATDASAKALADAVSVMLKALGEFGGKLDTLGPAAILGVFTAFFALCTLVSAWMARGS